MMRISQGIGPTPNVGKEQQVNFASLAAFVADYAPGGARHDQLFTGEKTSAQWFVPAKFEPQYRNAANFREAYAVVLDSDDGSLTAEIIRTKLAGLSYFAYPSYSYSEEKPKWRLVVELAAPVTSRTHYAAVADVLMARFGSDHAFDPRSRLPEQLWFWLSIHPEQKSAFRVLVGEGKPFDAASVAVPAEQPATAAAQVATLDPSELGVAALEAKAILDRYTLPSDKGCRDEWLRAGMAVHHHCAGSEEGFAVWHEWSAKQPGYASVEDCRSRWNSFGKRKSGEPVTLRSLENAMRAQVGYTVEELGFKAIPGAQWTEPLTRDAGRAHETAQVAIAIAADPYAEIPHAESITRKCEAVRSAPKSGLLKVQGISPEDYLRSDYLIKHWIDRRANALAFGPWNAGKSFVLLDICAAIATGTPWFGSRVNRGRCLYATYEGWRSMRKRWATLRTKYPTLDSAPVDISQLTYPLTTQDGQRQLGERLSEFAATYGGPPDLLIIDPLQQALGGDDSDATLMGKIGTLVNVITERQGCAVLRCHHSGHTERSRSRGHSSLPAGVDTEFRIEMTSEQQRLGEITATKQRDDSKSKLRYQLEVVQLGRDQDGDAVSSCIVRPAPVGAAELPSLSPRQQCMLNLILTVTRNRGPVARSCVLDAGRTFPGPKGKPLLNPEDMEKARNQAHKLFTALDKKKRIQATSETVRPLELGAGAVFAETGSALEEDAEED